MEDSVWLVLFILSIGLNWILIAGFFLTWTNWSKLFHFHASQYLFDPISVFYDLLEFQFIFYITELQANHFSYQEQTISFFWLPTTSSLSIDQLMVVLQVLLVVCLFELDFMELKVFWLHWSWFCVLCGFQFVWVTLFRAVYCWDYLGFLIQGLSF